MLNLKQVWKKWHMLQTTESAAVYVIWQSCFSMYDKVEQGEPFHTKFRFQLFQPSKRGGWRSVNMKDACNSQFDQEF